ncbi:MAG: divalent-cation tolerance protein CutA [Candidatus Micrarchaeia archaeon]
MKELLVTCKNEGEARKIALATVSGRLAACVNYWPVKSIYRWRGKVFREREWMLSLKTTTKKAAALNKKIRALHSYELPAIIVLSGRASKQVEHWIAESTR